MILEAIGEIIVGVVESVGEAIGDVFTSDGATAKTPTVADSGAAHGIRTNGQSIVSTTARVTGELAAQAPQLVIDYAVDSNKEKCELPVIEFILENGLYHASIFNGFDFAKNHQQPQAAGAVKYPVIGPQDIPKGKIIKNKDVLYFEFTTSHQFSTLRGERCNKSGRLRYLIVKTKI